MMYISSQISKIVCIIALIEDAWMDSLASLVFTSMLMDTVLDFIYLSTGAQRRRLFDILMEK